MRSGGGARGEVRFRECRGTHQVSWDQDTIDDLDCGSARTDVRYHNVGRRSPGGYHLRLACRVTGTAHLLPAMLVSSGSHIK